MQHGLAKGAFSQALCFSSVKLDESLDVPNDILVQTLAQRPSQRSHPRLIRQSKTHANLPKLAMSETP